MLVHVVLLVLCCLCWINLVESIFGFGKKREQEEEKRRRGSRDGGEDEDLLHHRSDAEIGLAGLSEVANNPQMMKDLMADLKDPETMEEVRKLMNDPAFIAEMEQLKNTPQFKKAMDSASERLESLSTDPAKLESIKAKYKTKASR